MPFIAETKRHECRILCQFHPHSARTFDYEPVSFGDETFYLLDSTALNWISSTNRVEFLLIQRRRLTYQSTLTPPPHPANFSAPCHMAFYY